ncbi:MAG: heme exporter protein CcmB [Burkholderiaceae bacterium]|jgi:heme exporter protein B|nr:heme exporter protein CcmB [Burkholderiales bacterium]MCZ8104219.1 heme exporter protein CcmB [Burkholderiales bacterium]MCZ8340987.1 heme exporter protein CcmB [Burkholderiaceae bacterium]
MTGLGAFAWALRRDLRLAIRRRSDALNVLGFFVLACSMFPLAIGPQREWLMRIGPGVIWVAALLATMLALPRLFEHDHADGTLDAMIASGRSLPLIVAGKLLAAWLVTALPLIVLTPVLGVAFSLPDGALPTMLVSLALGTPILLGLGAIAGALTLGLRAGPTLVTMLCLPLCVPVLVFGAGAVEAQASGLSPDAHLALLAAGMLMVALAAPPVAAQALRISVE